MRALLYYLPHDIVNLIAYKLTRIQFAAIHAEYNCLYSSLEDWFIGARECTILWSKINEGYAANYRDIVHEFRRDGYLLHGGKSTFRLPANY